jgi:hypothetical protein
VADDQNFALTPIVATTYGSMLDKNGHEILPRKTNIVNRLTFNINQGDNWTDMPTNGNWAKGTLTDLKAWQTYFRTSWTNRSGVVTNDFPTAPQPQTPAKDVLLALSKYDSALQELRAASELPESRFPLEYDKEDPASILLPHLAALKNCEIFLQLRSLAELEDGQTDQAAADVKLMFRLIRAVHTEPFLISHLVRIVMLNLTLQPVYEGLAEHRWSDAQLNAIDSQLAELNFVADYKLCMRSETAATAKMIEYLRRTRKVSEYVGMFNNAEPNRPGWIPLSYICPSGWLHQNQISFAAYYLQECLPAADEQNRTFLPKTAEQAQANLEAAIAHPTIDNFLVSVLYSPIKDWFSNTERKFAYAQESADLARVAIALEHHRLAHGDYPESLKTLDPQLGEKLPRDVIGGQPLNYHRTAQGFVLYSIGWDEKDDGGNVAFRPQGSLDPDNGDWVWSYPAK